MNLIIKYKLVLLCILLNIHLGAQSYSYKTYHPHNGLVHYQVMCVYQDAHGHMWSGTKGGLSRYDGNEFVNFKDYEEGLNDIEVIAIQEMLNGEIWIASKNGVSVYANHKLTPYQIDGFVLEKGVSFDTGGKIYGRDVDRNLYEIWIEADSIYANKLLKSGDYISYKYDQFNKRLVVLGLDEKVRFYEDNAWNSVAIEVKFPAKLLLDHKGEVLIRMHERLYLATNDSLEYKCNLIKNALHITFANENDYYCVLGDKLIKANTQNDESSFIGNTFNVVNQILIDHEGSVWLATEQGLLYYPDQYFENFHPSEDGLPKYVWTMLEDDKKNVWFASYSDGLCHFDGEDFTRINLSNVPAWGASKMSQFYYGGTKRKGELLFSTNSGVLGCKDEKFYKLKNSGSEAVLYLYFDESADKLFIGTKRAVRVINQNGEVDVIDSQDGLRTRRYIISIEKDKYGDMWFGSYDGLQQYKPASLEFVDFTDSLPDKVGVISIKQMENGELWLGTTIGLFCYNFDEKKIKQLLPTQLNTSVNFIIPMDNDRIVLGLLDGIGIIEENGGQLSIEKYNHRNGYNGFNTDQNNFLIDSKGKLWIAAANQVTRLDPSKLSSKVEDNFKFISVRSQTKDLSTFHYNPNENSAIPKDQNNVSIDICNISFLRSEDIVYEYALLRNKKVYKKDIASHAIPTFNNLPKGAYQFTIGHAEMQSKSLSFSIRPAWHETILAYIIYTALGAGLIMLILMYFSEKSSNRSLKKENFKLESLRKENELYKVKQELKELSLEAVQAQMNFHFTSNALNSIQYFIYNDQKEVAAQYLNDLTKLLRSFLDAVRNKSYALQNEINFIKLYVAFEQLRFEDKFDFDLKIGSRVELDELIPPMMIQPFVENAIHHGILQKESKGKIQVNIDQSKGQLYCKIKDDGIGRIRANKLKEKAFNAHNSNGLYLFEKRMELLQKSRERNIEFTIEDLYPHKKDKGTRVIVKLSIDDEEE